MAYTTGDQAQIKTLSGSPDAATKADAFRWALNYDRPPRNVTPFGNAITVFRATRPNGGGYFDVMVADSASAPPIPTNTQCTFEFNSSGTTHGYSGTLKIVSYRTMADNWSAETQFVRYQFVLDGALTVA